VRVKSVAEAEPRCTVTVVFPPAAPDAYHSSASSEPEALANVARIHNPPWLSVTEETSAPFPVKTASTSKWPLLTPVRETVCELATVVFACADWASAIAIRLRSAVEGLLRG